MTGRTVFINQQQINCFKFRMLSQRFALLDLFWQETLKLCNPLGSFVSRFVKFVKPQVC